MLETLNEIYAADQIGFPLLTLLIFLPLAAAIAVAFLKDDRQIRTTALGATVATFVLSLILPAVFQRGIPDIQFAERSLWIPPLGITYHVGVDGISILLILLTTFLSVLILLFSLTSIKAYVKQYMICLLVIETTVVGVFAALDLFLFFLFWEIMLIPMYFLIKTWGGTRRDYASLKFVLYTLLGSVLMLVGFAVLYLNYHAYAVAQNLPQSYSFDLLDLLKAPLSSEKQMWIFTFLFFGFAFKVPMFPFHTWLPDAHVEAPTAGSVLLAGVLLKMGTYGFVRFSLPLLPAASARFVPLMSILAVIGIVYGALLALAQDDIKKLIAYSSISHLGFVILGIFALNRTGIQGGMIQMVNHGVSTAGLFLVVGFLYERRHTRAISEYGGLARRVPLLAAFYLIISLSSMGFPGTNGFVGELLILVGSARSDWRFAMMAIGGVLLGAAYLLWLYQRTMMGAMTNPKNETLLDLDRREIGICAALAVMILWVGIYPLPFVKIMDGSIQYVASRVEPKTMVQEIVQEKSLEPTTDRNEKAVPVLTPVSTSHRPGPDQQSSRGVGAVEDLSFGSSGKAPTLNGAAP
ncbi:MAG TPA: NADH-quinone oxidoreductase subunit M [Candidatus Manganitrophaceae bacterium]|nr:NADH-quinone oxidoreductase subunit M [Candidatus Manganitrophaceae bacterium]